MGGCLSDHFDEPADATPLEPEEREGLLQTWITYRRDLNEAEQTNIAAGTAWAWHVRRRDLLSENFLRQLHKRLFGDVWAWAGEFRRTERNIGIDPVRIPVELRTAFVTQQPVDLLDAVLAEPAGGLGQALTDGVHGQRGAGEYAKRCIRKRQHSLRIQVAIVQIGDEFAETVSSQHSLLGHHLAPDWHADTMVIPKLRIGNANRWPPGNGREISLPHRQIPALPAREIAQELIRRKRSIGWVDKLKRKMRESLSLTWPSHSASVPAKNATPCCSPAPSTSSTPWPPPRPSAGSSRASTATSSRACSYSTNSDTSPSTKPAPTCCSRSSARDMSAAPPSSTLFGI